MAAVCYCSLHHLQKHNMNELVSIWFSIISFKHQHAMPMLVINSILNFCVIVLYCQQFVFMLLNLSF